MLRFSFLVFCFLIGNYAYGEVSLPDGVSQIILDRLLEAQGTSLDRIANRIAASNGNASSVVNIFNSELKEILLEENGDSLRIGLEGIKKLLGNTAQHSITQLTNNSLLSSLLRPTIDGQLNSRDSQLQTWINDNPIPFDSLRIPVADSSGVDATNEEQGVRRKREALQRSPRDLVTDISIPIAGTLDFILAAVNEIIKSTVSSVLDELQCTIGEMILSPVKGILNSIIDTVIPCSNCSSL